MVKQAVVIIVSDQIIEETIVGVETLKWSYVTGKTFIGIYFAERTRLGFLRN